MNFEHYLRNYKEVIDKEVEGWFYPKDIIITYGILKELQKPKGDVCEIGVAYGKSAIAISQFIGNNNFYLYDIFSESDKEEAENGKVEAMVIVPPVAGGPLDVYGKKR